MAAFVFMNGLIKDLHSKVPMGKIKKGTKHVAATLLLPLDWNSPCRGEGASHQEVSNRVRQREELNWASQLKSTDQQIFSRMSGTDLPLLDKIRKAFSS